MFLMVARATITCMAAKVMTPIYLNRVMVQTPSETGWGSMP